MVDEPSTEGLRAILDDDRDQTVWCLTPVEIASALARRTRDGLLPHGEDSFRSVWKLLSDHWRENASLERVRARALRLLSVHSLRSGDALQLAAALVASDDRPETLPFVCLDDRLREAARREGFPVLP
jgi:hypothetical protein